MPETTLVAPKISPLAIMAQRFNLETDKMIGVLRGTVIRRTKDGREASNEEIAAFVIVANQYKLNPFTKEIYAYPDKRGGIVPIVSVDGWARIVNDEPRFNGCEFEEMHDEQGKLVCTTCTMHVKGRDYPVRVTEYLSECHRQTDPWNGMPRRMLRHKAFIQAGRYAFSLSGIYDEDEGADILTGRVPSIESRIAGDVRKMAPPLQPPKRLSAQPQQQANEQLSATPPDRDAAPPDADDHADAAPPDPVLETAPPATSGELSPLDEMLERVGNSFDLVDGVVLEAANKKAKPLYGKGQKALTDLNGVQLEKLEAALCSEFEQTRPV